MGKKSGSSGGAKGGKVQARAFVLKVAMHCQCDGCLDKIHAAVRSLTLLQGVEAVDQSALETSGEVRLLATADPEMLRKRLRKDTRKSVDLLLPKEPKPAKKEDDRGAHLAAAQALLAGLQQQAPGQYGQTGAWVSQNQLMGLGGGWNAGNYGAATQAAYPWAASSYPAAAAAGWEAYAYPPPGAPAHGQGHGGYYGGGSPAWHTHGHGY